MSHRVITSLGAAIVIVVLSACGVEAETPATETSPAAAPRCLPEGATEVRFAGDGVELAGAIAGGGELGLILVHGTGPDGRCVWSRELSDIADAGFQVLAMDHACVGDSGCPAAVDLVADIRAAAAELRRRGASVVGVLGASGGTAESLVAAAGTHVDAVVALSPVELDTVVTAATPATAASASAQTRVPVLLVAGDRDRFLDVEDVRAYAATLPAELATLMVIEGGGHAQQLITADGDDARPDGPVYDAVLTFLRDQLAVD